MLRLLKLGQKYADKWPKHAIVAAFTESKVVPATRIAITYMPAFAVINLLVQWQVNGQEWTPQAIATSLFLLMLPLQGLYWLGARAEKPLPPRLRHWYQDLQQKLKQANRPTPSAAGEPTYMDLVIVLRKALAELPPDEH